ncbi:Hypothetical Protein SiL_0736 [Sulfolobus islandicus LAL14/1]|uniref:Uncharacterized protein n=1 Tax=Saccharolobus islandicus LAL14/1 TaxID=1241935 RepID=M9U5A7_SACIS|nr:Hypothetical Protein SiL_0736 [Sulfolobus islandicus LAL14/1]
MMLMTLLPSSIGGLMGLWEGQPLSPFSFKGLELCNESPLLTLSKWEWISDPLDCPPDERCSPESMVGTMNPLEGNHRPSRAVRKSAKNLPLKQKLNQIIRP